MDLCQAFARPQKRILRNESPLNSACKGFVRKCFKRIRRVEPTLQRKAKGDDSLEVEAAALESAWLTCAVHTRLAQWALLEGTESKVLQGSGYYEWLRALGDEEGTSFVRCVLLGSLAAVAPRSIKSRAL
eukprot:6405500-Amphidinium_carterae.1